MTEAPYPWQQAQWRTLMERLRAGRLAHGLLLYGPAGTGKEAFAERLAYALLCRQPRADGAPCGTCQACALNAAGTHPDLARVHPEDSKFIRVDQIRALSARLSVTSQLGGYRVAVIAPAQRMNAEAANSLLKTLEEPGADTVLLLVSSQPARLPATIRSRCQRVAFPLPPADVAAGWLRDCGHDEDPAALLALADGAPLAALQLAQEGGAAQRQALLEDLEALLLRQQDPVQLAAKWQGLELEQGLRWIGSWTSDMIRLQAVAAPPHLSSGGRSEQLAALARRLPAEAWFAQLDRVGEARRLLHTAVSPQAILEQVLIPLKNAGSGR